jgi:DNA-binding transcriptional MerR regulator
MPRRPAGRSQKKLFHKIGEVCELTETEPYVLRYWESEFPFLAPEKNRAGQRIYSDEDIETVNAIKRLLYEEGYTTAGARRRLEKELADRRAEAATGSRPAPARKGPPKAASAGDEAPWQETVRAVRAALLEVRDLLAGNRAAGAEATAPSAAEPAARRRSAPRKKR